MPGYMILLWIWEKALGPSEYGLRALNIPTFMGAITVICFGLRTSFQRKLLFVILTCSSAFLWAYLDEARPYIMEFFGSTLVLTGLYNLLSCSSRETVTGDSSFVIIGLLSLIAVSLSTIFFVCIFGTIFLLVLYRNYQLTDLHQRAVLIVILLVSLTIGGVIGVYYFWTLHIGAKASSVGVTNFTSILFCCYELIGFMGLGPDRATLREMPFIALKQYLPAITLYATAGICVFLVCITSIRLKDKESHKCVSVLIFAAFLGIFMMFLLGIGTHFRVLGRHLMPAFPFLIFALATGCDKALCKYRRLAWCSISVFVVLSLFSCLQFRCSGRHAKDDYRNAAVFAKASLASGGRVWWGADPAGAEYYGLPIGKPDEGGTIDPNFAVNVIGISEIVRDAIHPPCVVILSKEDIYDPSGSLRTWMDKHHFMIGYQFPSFKVYFSN